MRRRLRWLGVVSGAALTIAAGCPSLAARPPVLRPASGSGLPPALWPPCDQFNPLSPARTARIALDLRDLVDRGSFRPELRSFIETGSLGRAEVAVIGATPQGVVRAVAAAPEVSRPSRYFGERLKGVALAVALASDAAPVRVVVELRQVCARHFRHTFLYY